MAIMIYLLFISDFYKKNIKAEEQARKTTRNTHRWEEKNGIPNRKHANGKQNNNKDVYTGKI